jgi:hypothetical protein
MLLSVHRMSPRVRVVLTGTIGQNALSYLSSKFIQKLQFHVVHRRSDLRSAMNTLLQLIIIAFTQKSFYSSPLIIVERLTLLYFWCDKKLCLFFLKQRSFLSELAMRKWLNRSFITIYGFGSLNITTAAALFFDRT